MVKPNMILTPSVSVVVFTMDSDPQMSKSETCQQIFDQSPWKFHHVMEVNTTKQKSNRIQAKQEFYELIPELPLFSIRTTHFGKQILRINIVTYNHSEMSDFYSSLLGHNPVYVRPDFSFFTFQYTANVTLQLALKGASNFMPYPTNNADLVFSLNELPKHLQLRKVSEELHSTVDPDNNCLLIRCETNVKSVFSTQPNSIYSELSDLVQIDTEELKSSDKNPTQSDCTRPDVIPPQDFCLVLSPRERISRSISIDNETVATRYRSGSPANHRRKLVICTKSTTVSDFTSSPSLTEIDSNPLSKRRGSIDILESF